MELIILAAVIIALIGMFKSMDKTERAVVASSTANTTGIIATYAFKGVKATIKHSYTAGSIMGKEISLNQQDSILALAEWNEKIHKEGGATKVGVKLANEHSKTLGLTDAIEDLNSKDKELAERVRKARELVEKIHREANPELI